MFHSLFSFFIWRIWKCRWSVRSRMFWNPHGSPKFPKRISVLHVCWWVSLSALERHRRGQVGSQPFPSITRFGKFHPKPVAGRHPTSMIAVLAMYATILGQVLLPDFSIHYSDENPVSFTLPGNRSGITFMFIVFFLQDSIWSHSQKFVIGDFGCYIWSCCHRRHTYSIDSHILFAYQAHGKVRIQHRQWQLFTRPLIAVTHILWLVYWHTATGAFTRSSASPLLHHLVQLLHS